MSQSWFSLGLLYQNSLWKLSTFLGYKGIYSRVCEECEKSFFCKIGHSGDSLVSGMSREFELQDNYQARLYFLSCNALVVVTLQLPACFTLMAIWWVDSLVTHEIQSWESFWMLIHLKSSLSHTQPLHNSHLNTGYLIVEIQANLARNKANTWLNKFNLTKVLLCFGLWFCF